MSVFSIGSHQREEGIVWEISKMAPPPPVKSLGVEIF